MGGLNSSSSSRPISNGSNVGDKLSRPRTLRSSLERSNIIAHEESAQKHSPRKDTRSGLERGTKRKRVAESSSSRSSSPLSERELSSPPPQTRDDTPLDEEESTQQSGEITRASVKRNFDKVNFGHWQMKTWYFSPYPISESDDNALPPPHVALSSTAATPSEGGPSQVVSLGKGKGKGKANGIESDAVDVGDGEVKGLLWVCDRCFKYMKDGNLYEMHSKCCMVKHPPGRKVYQRGAHTVWEVDGAKQKLYCQNLSLFGKFFIDIKTLFFDCDNFIFYLLTDAESQRDHVLGFFSKEKVSYDDFNLACIVTLPPYQKKGYGMLMIEFSYELSRRERKLGTPERPLSDLGLRSYVRYWVGALVRFFRAVLTTPECEKVEVVEEEDGDSPRRSSKRKKLKGFDGEDSRSTPSCTAISVVQEPSFGSLRTTYSTVDPKTGKSTSHLKINCTLLEIARGTNLRPDDVTCAMLECGLLADTERKKGDNGGEEAPIVITTEMVERVANEWAVKPMCMEFKHILL